MQPALSPSNEPHAASDAPSRTGFGTAYYPDHWPESDWARDLDHIASLGIDTVRFGEFSWAWFEPRPGKFDFRAYERFVALCEQRKLKLVLCTPTATPPPWMIAKFPDGRLMDGHGRPCIRPRHFWSWSHGESRKQAEKTIRKLVGTFAGHPSVVSWQIDNEPNLAESDVVYDYNPHAIARFRQWLKERYHDSLDAVNRAWYTAFWSQTYGDWDEIGTLVFHETNPNAWLDFARFREHSLAEFVRWTRDVIRSADPTAKCGCNIPDAGLKISALIGQDYFDQAKGLDWVGTDLYYATGDRAADLRNLRYSTDLMRSAAGDAEFVLSETQAGPHQRTWPQPFAGEAWGANYLEQSVRGYVEHGARQVWLFLFRPTPGGVEIGMNGLTAPDGGPSERTELVKRLIGAAEQGRLTAPRDKRDKRKLALMHYSRDTIRFMTFWRSGLDLLEQSYLGWHRLLDEAGYRVRFVSDEQLEAGLMEPGFNDAKLLVMPQSHVLSDAQIDAAVKFAGRSKLIVGPHTAMLDGHGQLRQRQPGGLIAKLAGVTPGFWHDVRVSASAGPLKPEAVDAYRAAEVKGGDGVVTKFSSPRGVPAIVNRKRTTWAALDLGRAYNRTGNAGRAWIRRAVGL